MDVEVNPADVAAVRIRYRGWAPPSSASPCQSCTSCCSATPNGDAPSCPGCESGSAFHRLRDTWAGNTPCLASLGELGWEGCADEEILLFSCGLSPPTPGSARSTSPATPPPAEKPKPPYLAPSPQTHATQKAPPSEAQVLRIGKQLLRTRHTPVDMGRG